MVQHIKEEWFSNIRGDVLAGIVVALALIPEAIAFVRGRPGIISAATGAMALLMIPLVKEHGLNYLLVATILTGVIQLLFGVFKIAK